MVCDLLCVGELFGLYKNDLELCGHTDIHSLVSVVVTHIVSGLIIVVLGEAALILRLHLVLLVLRLVVIIILIRSHTQRIFNSIEKSHFLLFFLSYIYLFI